MEKYTKMKLSIVREKVKTLSRCCELDWRLTSSKDIKEVNIFQLMIFNESISPSNVSDNNKERLTEIV